MRKSTLETLRMRFEISGEESNSGIREEYVVNGDVPKVLGNSLAEQIRNSNNTIRKKGKH